MIAPAAADTVSWTATGDGVWQEPANWSTGAVPAAGDVVEIATGSGVTVTYADGETRIAGLSADCTLDLTGGRLTLSGPSSLAGPLRLRAGAGLIADAPTAAVDIAGPLHLDGGDLLAVNGARLLVTGAIERPDHRGLLRAQGSGSRIDIASLEGIGVTPYTGDDLTQGISRVIAVYHGQMDRPSLLDDLREGVSRVVAVYHGPADDPDALADVREAVSRVVAIYHGPTDAAEPTADLREGISRALSVYHGASDGPDPLDDLREGVSRAVGVRHE